MGGSNRKTAKKINALALRRGSEHVLDSARFRTPPPHQTLQSSRAPTRVEPTHTHFHTQTHTSNRTNGTKYMCRMFAMGMFRVDFRYTFRYMTHTTLNHTITEPSELCIVLCRIPMALAEARSFRISRPHQRKHNTISLTMKIKQVNPLWRMAHVFEGKRRRAVVTVKVWRQATTTTTDETPWRRGEKGRRDERS